MGFVKIKNIQAQEYIDTSSNTAEYITQQIQVEEFISIASTAEEYITQALIAEDSI